MRLEKEYIDIKDVKFGDKTCVRDHVLYVNKKEAEAHLLEDRRLGGITLDLVYPGEDTRIVNVFDISQPCCKVGEGSDFPGWIGKIQTAGSGVTRVLRGTAVIITHPDTDRQYLAFLDMGGPAGKLSKYAAMPNLVLTPEMPQEIDMSDYDVALQLAGFKLSVYLAKAAAGVPVDDRKVYEHEFSELPRDSKLPRIAYFYQLYTPQYDHKAIPEPFFYGSNVKNFIPTILHPNEVLDGGIVGYVPNKSLDTYSLQNHAIINELYDRHGKDLLFCGMIVGVAHPNSIERDRRACIAANLAKDILSADGIVMTKIHGGMAHMDLATTGIACEKRGVKPVLQYQGLTSPGTKAGNAYFKDASLTAIMHMGVTTERVRIEFNVKRVLGGTPESVIFSPYNEIMKAKDKVIYGEEFSICGVHDHTGGSSVTAVDF
jgi:glycine reductase